MSRLNGALEITGKHVGQTATRILLNSGSYVVAHFDGQYTCIHSACINARQANDCEHVRFVRDHDTPDEVDSDVQPV